MNVTITGATGFIGRRLAEVLQQNGHQVRPLSRTEWNVTAAEPPAQSLVKADAIVHLAGEPVAQRWTLEAKRKILDSRVRGTHNIVTALSTFFLSEDLRLLLVAPIAKRVSGRCLQRMGAASRSRRIAGHARREIADRYRAGQKWRSVAENAAAFPCIRRRKNRLRPAMDVLDSPG